MVDILIKWIIEPKHFPGADKQMMFLPYPETMLIRWNIEGWIGKSIADTLVIGDLRCIIAEHLIDPVYSPDCCHFLQSGPTIPLNENGNYTFSSNDCQVPHMGYRIFSEKGLVPGNHKRCHEIYNSLNSQKEYQKINKQAEIFPKSSSSCKVKRNWQEAGY